MKLSKKQQEFLRFVKLADQRGLDAYFDFGRRSVKIEFPHSNMTDEFNRQTLDSLVKKGLVEYACARRWGSAWVKLVK